jgi:hypothetical protein
MGTPALEAEVCCQELASKIKKEHPILKLATTDGTPAVL